MASISGARSCFRCGSPMTGSDMGARHTVGVAAMATSGLDLAPRSEPANPSAPIDDWEMDQAARRLRRFIERPASAAADPPPAPRRDVAARVPLRPRRAAKSMADDRDAAPRASAWAWLLILLGLVACLGGGGLVGWSYGSGRDELWNLGLPIAAGGQLALLLGLALQLQRIWHGSREAARRLRNVDRRLQQIKRSADELAASHRASASAFYRHYADGASPNLLLADLKGQLDLLSARLSSR